MNRIIMAAALATAAAGAVWAHEGEHEGQPEKAHAEMFQQRKTHMLADLDAQIGMMQAFRTCLAAAEDEPAAKRCHEERQKREKEMRAKMAVKRKADIDDQIQRLQKEKERLDQQESDGDKK